MVIAFFHWTAESLHRLRKRIRMIKGIVEVENGVQEGEDRCR